MQPPFNQIPINSIKAKQSGFTLIELLVALTIFVSLALASWQVFNGLHRSHTQAHQQYVLMGDLQHTHISLAQDLDVAIMALEPLDQGSASTQWQSSTLTLNDGILTFMRHAPPDLTQPIPLQHTQSVTYQLTDNQLIKTVTMRSSSDRTERTQTYLLLDQLTDASIRLLPHNQTDYPDGSSNLPTGVEMRFTIQLGAQAVPIVWRFALPAKPPMLKPQPIEQDDDA